MRLLEKLFRKSDPPRSQLDMSALSSEQHEELAHYGRRAEDSGAHPEVLDSGDEPVRLVHTIPDLAMPTGFRRDIVLCKGPETGRAAAMKLIRSIDKPQKGEAVAVVFLDDDFPCRSMSWRENGGLWEIVFPERIGADPKAWTDWDVQAPREWNAEGVLDSLRRVRRGLEQRQVPNTHYTKKALDHLDTLERVSEAFANMLVHGETARREEIIAGLGVKLAKECLELVDGGVSYDEATRIHNLCSRYIKMAEG